MSGITYLQLDCLNDLQHDLHESKSTVTKGPHVHEKQIDQRRITKEIKYTQLTHFYHRGAKYLGKIPNILKTWKVGLLSKSNATTIHFGLVFA